MNNKSQLIESVYSLDLTQRATLVVFYLINRADKDGTCFPGVKTIARECNISTRTVQRALNDLEETGFLVRESRFHVQGGQRSSLYHLVAIEEEKDNTKMAENQEDKNTGKTDITALNTEQINVEIYDSQKGSINIDLTAINFKELLEECVSRSPCQDGIP